MANVRPNNRRALTGALKRFSSMLIEEAKDISGLTYAELDESLEYEYGTTSRYAQRKRAPNAEDVQDLENRVARLLKRPSHIVTIESNELISNGSLAELAIGWPDRNLDLRDLNAITLQLGYEDDWPTYRRLKYSPRHGGVRLLDLYAWQWGVLWDRNVLPAPWSREVLGISCDAPVEAFLPHLVEQAKKERLAYVAMRRLCTPAAKRAEQL